MKRGHILVSGGPFVVSEYHLHGSTPIDENPQSGSRVLRLPDAPDFNTLNFAELKKWAEENDTSADFVKRHGGLNKKQTWIDALEDAVTTNHAPTRCFGGSTLFHLSLFISHLYDDLTGRIDLYRIPWPGNVARIVSNGGLPEEVSIIDPHSIAEFREPWRIFIDRDKPVFDSIAMSKHGYDAWSFDFALRFAKRRLSNISILSAVVSFGGEREICEAIIQKSRPRRHEGSTGPNDASHDKQEMSESEEARLFEMRGRTILWSDNGVFKRVALPPMPALFMETLLSRSKSGVLEKEEWLKAHDTSTGAQKNEWEPRPKQYFRSEKYEPVWDRWVEEIKGGWRLKASEKIPE